MKKILFALVAVLTVFAIVRFNALQIWLLEHDYSWTMAKALPYVAVALLGIVLAYFFAGAFKLSSKVLKVALVTVLFALPFAVSFALNPIYEGDFSSQGTEVSSDSIVVNEKYDLLVITIPDCPYCLESIGRLKMIKKQQPEIDILFSVCTTDPGKLELYKEVIGGDFDIEVAPNPEESMKFAGGSFPAFFRVTQGNPVYHWSNNQFGAGAIDDLIGGL